MSNDEIMEVLLDLDNLKDLSYENNTITYNGKSVDISSIHLADFFESPFSQMYLDQRTISCEDFLNVMQIHATKIKDKLNNENNIGDIEKMAMNYLSNNS